MYTVKTFAEKPSETTAVQFIQSGDFLWNSGMFVWRAETIVREIMKLLPDLYLELVKIDGTIGSEAYDLTLETRYRKIRGISIDYGVMEKAGEVYVLKGNFGWSDVGSWDEVKRLSGKDEQSNTVTGKVFLHKTKNTYVHAGTKFVATVDVEDLIVIATDDAVLVCRQGHSQDVKEVVDYLRRKQLNDYL